MALSFYLDEQRIVMISCAQIVTKTHVSRRIFRNSRNKYMDYLKWKRKVKQEVVGMSNDSVNLLDAF